MYYCNVCGAPLQPGTGLCLNCGPVVDAKKLQEINRNIEYQENKANVQNDFTKTPVNQQMGEAHNYQPMPSYPSNYEKNGRADIAWRKCLILSLLYLVCSFFFVSYSNSSGWHGGTIFNLMFGIEDKLFVLYFASPLLIIIALVISYYTHNSILTAMIILGYNLLHLWVDYHGLADTASIQDAINIMGIIAISTLIFLTVLEPYQYGVKLYDVSVLFAVLRMIFHIFNLLNSMGDESYFSFDISYFISTVCYYLQFGYWGLALKEEGYSL